MQGDRKGRPYRFVRVILAKITGVARNAHTNPHKRPTPPATARRHDTEVLLQAKRRMYMRLRGGGAAPCPPCNARAIPPELRTMGIYYPKKPLSFRFYYPKKPLKDFDFKDFFRNPASMEIIIFTASRTSRKTYFKEKKGLNGKHGILDNRRGARSAETGPAAMPIRAYSRR
jgi:hypothetical protein